MPVSSVINISAVMKEVLISQPKSVLDLGVGFGKYGVLCRELLDATYGRIERSTWTTRICGVEGFEQYRNECWQLYDEVCVENFAEHYEKYKGFDLVLMIDSLEHVEKTWGMAIVQQLTQNNKSLIVSVPLGDCPQGAVFGNDLESHRAMYTGLDDFKHFNYKQLHKGGSLVVALKGTY